jgi:hypothetical protein
MLRKSRQFKKLGLGVSRNLELHLDWSQLSRPPSLLNMHANVQAIAKLQCRFLYSSGSQPVVRVPLVVRRDASFFEKDQLKNIKWYSKTLFDYLVVRS